VSYESEHSQLRVRFNDQFSSAPIAWPNVEFTPPVRSPWVRFNVLDADSFQTTIGATTNNHRFVGIVVINIFVPLDVGNASALAMADVVAAIFRNWCGSTVRCRAASVKDLGPDGNGWYQVNVVVPFQRDELL
jgi:hypothetical protein